MRNILIASCITLALAACASTPSSTTTPKQASAPATTGTAQSAVANLAAASGSLVSGKLTLAPMGNGVHIRGVIGGFAPGSTHGFHIHENGDCSAADAKSAGGHFNPTGQPHGKAESGAHHLGDIDNIRADATGVAHVSAHVQGVVLGGGAINDIAGRAIIVHATGDDYTSQPSGDAGARIACGVIKVP